MPERTTLFPADRTGAVISPCGRYRYSLTRGWDPARAPVLFVMLNPSTADATKDDPTIRRCVGFARRWGAGGIEVCNLYPWRETNPRGLPRGVEVFGDPGHQANADAIRAAVARAGIVVAAWGAYPGPWPSQPNVIAALLRECRAYTQALGLTKDGAPRHPLYVRADAALIPFERGRHHA